jgi:hypothetical protein
VTNQDNMSSVCSSVVFMHMVLVAQVSSCRHKLRLLSKRNQYELMRDCLCDLVVRLPSYRSRSLGFDSRSFVSRMEELLLRNRSGSGQKTKNMASALTSRHPVSTNVGTNFADKRRLLGRCSPLAVKRH